MKAIQVHEFGGPEVLQYGDVDAPSVGPGLLHVRLKAAGVNPLETALRSGNHPRAASLQLPHIPGADASGEVIAVGDGVSGYAPGDRVYGAATTGSYAEEALLDPTRTALLPDNLSFEEGASLPIVLYTAYYAVVYKAAIRAGETLLVHGAAGGVGSMAVQVGKAAGARVIATVSSAEKGAFAKSLGADVVINYREEDFVERCREETGGLGVDAVIEMVATDNFDKDCAALRVFGRLVVLGAGTGKSPSGTVTYPPFYSKNIDVLGFSLFNAAPVFGDMLRQVGRLLSDGRVKPMVGETVPLADAPRSHELLMSGQVFGKIVLTM
jgi:NADPH2:quinone reductase